jgi:cytochrome c biogenesis protein CcmG/thiol:disulfide interchange protein DsbE
MPSKPPQMHIARPRQPLFLWALIGLSLATIALGVWAMQSRNAAPPAQILKVSRAVSTDFSLQATDGSQVTLSDLRGKVVLLNFWATWCPPCKAEMPDLEALYREYGATHDFVVVGVNLQEERETVEKFARAIGLSFPVLLDTDGKVSEQSYAVRSLPMSMIIDREGYIREAWTGQLSSAEMLNRLEQVW